MVNYEDKMQLFFSCLLKSKMNLFSIANMAKDKRITNLIDRINETENLIYLVCMERGVNISFDLNTCESLADYSYRLMEITTAEEYKEEVRKISTHICQHFGEIIRAHSETNEFHIVYEFSKASNAFYKAAREIYL